jgi:hypothetical protein
MEGGALRDWMNWAGHNDTGGVFAEAGGEGGPIGILIGLILDVLISMLLVFLVAFLLRLGLGALFYSHLCSCGSALLYGAKVATISRGARSELSRSGHQVFAPCSIFHRSEYGLALCILLIGHALGGFFAAP